MSRLCAVALAGWILLAAGAGTSHAADKANDKYGLPSNGIQDPTRPDAYMNDLASRVDSFHDTTLLTNGTNSSQPRPAPAPRPTPRPAPSPTAKPVSTPAPVKTVPTGLWSHKTSSTSAGMAVGQASPAPAPTTNTPANSAARLTGATPAQTTLTPTTGEAGTLPAPSTSASPAAVPAAPAAVPTVPSLNSVPGARATVPRGFGSRLMSGESETPVVETVRAAAEPAPAARPQTEAQPARNLPNTPAAAPAPLLTTVPAGTTLPTYTPAPAGAPIMAASSVDSAVPPVQVTPGYARRPMPQGPVSVESEIASSRTGLTLWNEPELVKQMMPAPTAGAAKAPAPEPEGPWTVGGDLEKYRAYSVKEGSRGSVESLKKALERTGMTLGDTVNIFVLGYASDRAKPFRANDGKGLFQEPGKVPQRAGATIGSLGLALYSVADLVTLNSLPDPNNAPYKDNNVLVRPVLFAGRTVGGIWKTTEEVGNALTWGLFDNVTGCLGLVIEDVVELAKHAGEAVTNVVRAPFHLAAGKKPHEATDQVLDWVLLVPLELASNSVEMKGFANMDDYKTAFRDKGVIGSVLEFGGSTYIVYRAIDELTKRDKKHDSDQNQTQDENQGGQPDNGGSGTDGGTTPSNPPAPEQPMEIIIDNSGGVYREIRRPIVETTTDTTGEFYFGLDGN